MRRPLPPQTTPRGRFIARAAALGHLAAIAGLLLVGVPAGANDAPVAPAAAVPPLAASAPASAPVPVADFFRVAQMARPRLSPSGRHLAVHVGSPGGRQRLAVLDVDPPRQARLVAGFDDADVGAVAWAGDDRLVFGLDDHMAAWNHRQSPGLFAVDRDGSNFRVLIQRDWRWITTTASVAARELPVNHRLLRVLTDGSADAVVLRDEYDIKGELTGRTPWRLDTRNGRTTALVDDAPQGARGWWFDGSGQPRMVSVVDGGQTDML